MICYFRPQSAGHSLRGSSLRPQTGAPAQGEDPAADQAGRAGGQAHGGLQREDTAWWLLVGFPGDPGDDQS